MAPDLFTPLGGTGDHVDEWISLIHLRFGDQLIDRFGAYGRGPSLYIHDPDGYNVELKHR